MHPKTMLAKIKEAAPMTVVEMAEALGVRERTVSRWMKGDGQPKAPNLRAIRALAARYGVR